MEELLDALIAKNITESNESLRLIVSSLNGSLFWLDLFLDWYTIVFLTGLAGIYLLLQNPSAAISHYRKVLDLAERFSKENKEVTVDTLQLIHTMHNLAEILTTFETVPRSLQDISLRDDCKKHEEKYIQKYIIQVKSFIICYKKNIILTFVFYFRAKQHWKKPIRFQSQFLSFSRILY